MTRLVVLLRAVNVGKRQLPMAALRADCAAAGLGAVRTYLASGNLVVESALPATEVEALVEGVVARSRGFHADAIARTAAEWRAYAAAAPFAAERAARAKMVHLCLAKRPLAEDVAPALTGRVTQGEQIARAGEALWIDFGDGGVARSKLTPAAIDRAAGSPVTARNWNSVVALLAMLDG